MFSGWLCQEKEAREFEEKRIKINEEEDAKTAKKRAKRQKKKQSKKKSEEPNGADSEAESTGQ